MFFWKKNKINKKFLGAKTVDVPKTAQKTIPFQEAYENGLFLNYDGSYSLIFSFQNIDYSLFRDEEKQEIYKKYTQLINTIPTDIHFQEFLMNTDIDTGTLTETLLSASYDYPEISDDYNSIYTAFLMTSSQWDGDLEVLANAKTPVYLATGKNDSYYGSQPLKNAYNKLRGIYESQGLTETEIDKILVLDVKDQAYFTERGYTDQHGGGMAFAHDETIMNWLFKNHST